MTSARMEVVVIDCLVADRHVTLGAAANWFIGIWDSAFMEQTELRRPEHGRTRSGAGM